MSARKWVCRVRSTAMLAVAVSGLLLVAGCWEDTAEDDDTLPPEGKGSMVVDNRTSDTIGVYVSGVRTATVHSLESVAVFLEPGFYRVVLSEEDGFRNYRGDVDVLLDHRTIMGVDRDASNASAYAVSLEFD